VRIAMNRFRAGLVSLVLLASAAPAQEAGGGAGADPARFFPSDTFAYAEVDAAALEGGLAETQLMRILSDPALRTLLKPAMERLGIDAEKPVEAVLKRFPVKDVLEGRAAVGVRGICIAVRDDQGKETRFRVAPGTPIDARLVYRYLGLLLRFDTAGLRKITIDIDTDFLAVGRPGPLGKQLIEQALAGMEGEVARTAVKVGDRDATHVRVDVPIIDGLTWGFNFYAAERDGTWFLATQTDVLAQALAGGPRAPLAGSAALAQARARFTAGRPLAFAHVDFAQALGMCGGLVAPVVAEMAEIAGLGAIRGFGLGVSVVDGGLRESVGILLDGNPRGCWRILEGFPAGLRSLEVAPPGALASFGLKLDLTILRERIRAFAADVVPGNEDEIEREITREFVPGFDLLADVLPALGDEIAVFLYPARANEFFPQIVLGVDARDEAALARLVEKVQAQIPANAVRFTPVDLPEGIKAVRVTAAVPYDLHFAIHKGHLFLASNAKLLGEVATKWGVEGSASLVRDDKVLAAVLKAMNGGDTKGLAALLYVNLRNSGLEAMKALPMLGGLPPDWFDPRGMAEVRRIPEHLTGAAISLRHDKDGPVLDAFSPVGVVLPAIATAILAERERAVQRAVAVRAAATNPTLGISQRSSDGNGVKVLALVAGGPAANAGLEQGDRIVALDGVAIAWMEDLERELAKKKPGDKAVLTIRRGAAEVTKEVELTGEEHGGW
jgi:hypothetical protein